MRKILAMVLAFCTMFSSVCTIVLAQEQSLFTASKEGTVSENEAVTLEDIVTSEILQEDENKPETVDVAATERNGEAAGNTVSGGNASGAGSGMVEKPATVISYAPYEGASYKLLCSIDNDEITIIGCEGIEEGELVIPAEVNGMPVVAIGDYAFPGSDQGRGFTGELKIPDGVKSIGNSAFDGCSGFTGDLRIPDSVTSIGERAFCSCSGLKGTLKISNNVDQIADYAFAWCGFTGVLEIPDSITSIGECAFVSSDGYTGSLKIPGNVTSIGECAFSGCKGITGLEISEGVTSIGDHAFELCGNIDGDLVIPSSVTSIGAKICMDCSFTGSLIIKANISRIDDYLFTGTRFAGSLVLPDGLTSIGYGAFNCCDFSGELNLPNTVTNIGDYAFAFCGFSGELNIADSVTVIGDGAFRNCVGFTGNLTIPASVTSIGKYAFGECEGLEADVYITDMTTNIGEDFFQYKNHVNKQNTIIHAPKGSYAETYAVENGYSYVEDDDYIHGGTENDSNTPPGTGDDNENKDTGSESGSEASKPDSNGGGNSSGNNNDTANKDDDKNLPAFFTDTTSLKIQVTTKSSDADKAADIKEGEYLQVEVSYKVEDSIRKDFRAVASDKGMTVLEIFNIDLKVLQKNGTLIRKVSEPDGVLTFTIPAPGGVDGTKYDFSVLRYHDGEIAVLPDLDDDPATITFASDRFSAYAVVYSAKSSSAVRQTSAQTSGQAKKDGVPKTGDELPVAVPATATVIFAILSCILWGQELQQKRTKKMRNS